MYKKRLQSAGLLGNRGFPTRIFKVFLLLIAGFTVVDVPSGLAQTPTGFQEYVIFGSESHFRRFADTAVAGYAAGDDIKSVVTLTATADNQIIYYDHWEDGYEADILDPQQSTTEVWGDNDPINGIAPGYPTDYIPSGGDFVFENQYIYNPSNFNSCGRC